MENPEPKIYSLNPDTAMPPTIPAISQFSLVPDPKGVEFIQAWQSKQQHLSEVLGNVEETLVGEYQIVRQEETNLGNLIADILLEASKDADIAFVNSGCIRSSIPQGTLTRGVLFTTLPYNNQVKIILVNGQTIHDILENAVAQYEKVSGAFLQVAGITFSFDPSKEQFNRVEEIKIQGEPLDLTKEYRLVTLEYLIQGGDDYIMLKDKPIVYTFPESLQELVVNYVKAHSPIHASCEGRITKIK